MLIYLQKYVRQALQIYNKKMYIIKEGLCQKVSEEEQKIYLVWAHFTLGSPKNNTQKHFFVCDIFH